MTSAGKAWVVHLACAKPKELGDAAELWTRSALAAHVRKEARTAGHSSLARAAKSTVQKILAEHIVPPHKVKYYLERRDPEFESKMKEVLMVYQAVMLQNQAEKQAALERRRASSRYRSTKNPGCRPLRIPRRICRRCRENILK